MAQQTINVGAAPNDGTGTPLRTAFQYTNSNFTELYTALGGGSGLPGASGQLIFNNGTSLAGDNELFYNATTNTLTTEKLIVPGNTQVAGSLSNLYVGSILNPTLFANTNTKLVGIVQATPLYPLHLVGEFGLEEASPAGTGSKLRFIGDATKYNFRLGKQLTANNTFEITPSTAAGGGTFSNPVYTVSYDGIHTFLNGAGGTRMTLNATGLGVGVASPARKFEVHGTPVSIGGTATGMLVTVANSSTAYNASPTSGLALWNKFNSSGNLFPSAAIQAGKENATDGNYAGFLSLYTVDSVGTPNEQMRIDSSGNVGIGVTPAGTGGCLQLKSGITFPATQVASSDANTLDDYEEGTFTPTIVGTTAAGVGTYNTQVGRYTKVGDLVTIQIYLDWTAHTGTGNMNIGALPFGFVNAAGVHSGASFGYVNGIAMTAGNILTGYGAPANNFITLNQTPTGGGASNTVPIDVAGSIIVTMTYKT